MSQKKSLLEITVHTDDDTGMYSVGELDFGFHGRCISYIEKHGYNGVKELLAMLGHLAFEVKEEYYKIEKRKPQNQASQQP